MSELNPEQLSREDLKIRQAERLHHLISRIESDNPFWNKRLKEAGLTSGDFRSVEDLSKLPLLTKQELVEDQNDNKPFGTNLTFPKTKHSRLHQTSGTTGKPMRWLDTPESWDWFMDCWAQIYRISQITPEDIFAFPFSFGPFIGFWAGFEGAQRLGNLSLTMGGMTSEARLKLILEMEATIVCCTPTYAMRLADVAHDLELPLNESAVRMLIVAGEPGGAIPAIRERIETSWGARVIDHWGMTDIGSLGIEPFANPGGLLILESECIAEVIHSKSGTPVQPGEEGELVITNLGRVSQPVIRYRTGDLVKVSCDPCLSGYQLMRLEGGILGRVDDMVTIRGNNVFPSSIDAILREIPDVVEYRIQVSTVRSMPHMTIEIEPTPTRLKSQESSDSLVKQIVQVIKDRLNFHAEIVVVGEGELPRFELKGRRFSKSE